MMLPVGGASSADGALHASAGIPIAAAHAHASHGKYLLRPTARPPSLQEFISGRTLLTVYAQVNDFCFFQRQNMSGCWRSAAGSGRSAPDDDRSAGNRAPIPRADGGEGQHDAQVLP